MALLSDIKLIFSALIIFQCLFFTIYLLSQAGARTRRNAWLGGFLLARMATALGSFLDHFLELRGFLLASAPWVLFLAMPFYYLAVPLLYFYILSLTREGFKFRVRHLLHLLPFVLACSLVAWRVGTTPAVALRAAIEQGTKYSSALGNIITFTLDAQFLGYAIAALFEVRSYRRRIKDLYSAVEKINLSWLGNLLVGFIAWETLEIIEYALWEANFTNPAIALYIFNQAVFLVFVSLIFMKGLRQPVIFLGLDSPKAQKKYEKTLLAEPLRTEYRDRLIRFMEEGKPFLNPLLSLPDLASAVKIPAHHLSQVLNGSFRQNFFDFVNGYRVKESQRLLAAREGQDKTILEILYETGFNSKSVFNTAFKKHTGMTPSEWKSRLNGAT
jgi:AraC-like DNA-binding protein